MTRPIRSGKCSFTSDGSSTLAIAIPDSASMESTRNDASAGANARPARPVTSASSAAIVVRCRPTRRATAGAAAPKAANASTGSEVSRPASLPDSESPARTSASTGPTLTAAGRRFTASRSSPASSRTSCAVDREDRDGEGRDIAREG